MTTLTQFSFTTNNNFQFNPTLDGLPYIAICTWNIYSPRYFISIYDTFNNLILSRPVVASPDDYDINLVEGYFTTSKLVYRGSSNNFEVTP